MESFASLIQTTCRSKGWVFDKSLMYSMATKIFDEKEITKRLDQGTYIQGIYLEGAKWSIENDCLD
jgi:dynein heavy chain